MSALRRGPPADFGSLAETAVEEGWVGPGWARDEEEAAVHNSAGRVASAAWAQRRDVEVDKVIAKLDPGELVPHNLNQRGQAHYTFQVAAEQQVRETKDIEDR